MNALIQAVRLGVACVTMALLFLFFPAPAFLLLATWAAVNALWAIARQDKMIRDSYDGRNVWKAILIGLFTAHTALASAFYLDPTATGTADGSSWANAFPSFAAVNAAQATVARGGNILYWSGGTTGQLYTLTAAGNQHASTSSTSGTSWFTNCVGQDAGHNGLVIIDGNNVATNGIQFGHSTYFSGLYNGLSNIIFKNFLLNTNTDREIGGGVAMNGGIATNIIIEYVRVDTANNGVAFNGGGCEVRHCAFTNIWGDFVFRMSGYGGTNFHNFWIHHCWARLNMDPQGILGGPDFCQGSNGATVEDCDAACQPGPVNAGQHPDFFQAAGSYNRCQRNRIMNFGNSVWECNAVQDLWIENYLVNNVIGFNDTNLIAQLSLPITVFRGIEPGFTQNPQHATNNIVGNNTFVDLPGVAFNGGLFTYQQGTASKFLWENNLIVNCGTGNAGAPSCAVIRGDGTLIVFDYNLLSAGSRGSTNLFLLDDGGSVYTPFVQTHSRNGSIAFASYSYLSPANDYHLAATDTAAMGTGTDMSAYYGTDFDGRQRTQWDIGAYARSAGGSSKINYPVSGQVAY